MSADSETFEAFPDREQYEQARQADERLIEWATSFHRTGTYPSQTQYESIRDAQAAAKKPLLDAVVARIAEAPTVGGDRIRRHHYGQAILPPGSVVVVEVPEVGQKYMEFNDGHVRVGDQQFKAGVNSQFALSLFVRYPHLSLTIADMIQMGYGRGMAYENSKRTALSTNMHHLRDDLKVALNGSAQSKDSALVFGQLGQEGLRTYRWVYDILEIQPGTPGAEPLAKPNPRVQSSPETEVKPEIENRLAELELKGDQFTLQGQAVDLNRVEADLMRLFYVLPKDGQDIQLSTKQIVSLLKDLYSVLDVKYLDMITASINAKLLAIAKPKKVWLPLTTIGPVGAPTAIQLNSRINCPRLSSEEQQEVMKDMIDRQRLVKIVRSIDKSR